VNLTSPDSSSVSGAVSTATRQVIVLPDDCFFVRRVPIEETPEAGAVRAQVELALEGFAPFPPAQMFYGYWMRPGAGQALVYAAYRKRFSAEELAGWAQADLVAPRLALVLATAAPAGATTWWAESPTGLTCWHFDDNNGVPARVITRAWPETAPATERAAAREAALRSVGETRAAVELGALEIEAGVPGEGDFVFHAGPVSARLPAEDALRVDVRDPAVLSAQRRARTRDRWLWRTWVAALVALGLGLVTKLTLTGLGAWQKSRLRQVAEQTPVVNQIMTARTLAARIDELSTQRLRPFEMIAVADSRRPAAIHFIRTVTRGRDTLVVDAQTTAQADIDAYRAALADLPETSVVEVRDLASREGRTTFTLVVSFAPGALARLGGGDASGEDES